LRTLGGTPVPADYLGIGRAQVADFVPGSAIWFIRALETTIQDVSGTPRPVTVQHPLGPIQWGMPGDLPVPGNYSAR
jgi:hypothetical protein